MSLTQELNSWLSPEKKDVRAVPTIGQQAPSSAQLDLSGGNGKRTIVAFLRHCGCPVAEKTFLAMRDAAAKHPDIHFVAVSHSDKAATDRWVESVGGSGAIKVVVDPERDLYAQWGLGISSFWHVLNPWALGSIVQLGRQEGIWNRPTESGSRWQTAGTFAVDATGKVVWGGPAKAASDVPDFDKALQAFA